MMHTISREPSAHITVNRNRLKTYGNKIYFNNNTHYEIELFNPLTQRVLVQIEIDGRTISSTGLIINPGQRAYLERWIDDSKKFLFSTYEVENSPEAKAAIQQNGKIKVSFYTEQNNFFLANSGNTTIITTTPYCPYTYTYGTGNNLTSGNCYFSSTPNIGVRGSAGPSGVKGLCSSESSNNLFCSDSMDASMSIDSSLETGRTEMGAQSDQTFGESSGNFNSWPTTTVEWQLLPESLKPVEISKIRGYCPGCRNRIRKETWKFCPACGESLI